jgi:hypothetical protein
LRPRGLPNIRLWDGDATDLLPGLPEGSIGGVDLLYPDPWPKRRQRKRRIVSDAFLAALARVMRPGGKFRFATDIDDYAGWTLARALRSPDFAWEAARPEDWRQPWAGWPGTRYEAKALRRGAGRAISRSGALRALSSEVGRFHASEPALVEGGRAAKRKFLDQLGVEGFAHGRAVAEDGGFSGRDEIERNRAQFGTRQASAHQPEARGFRRPRNVHVGGSRLDQTRDQNVAAARLQGFLEPG